MMKCITRYEMKFGDIIIPERTECTIIGKEHEYNVNCSGVQLNLAIRNWDIGLKDKTNENKVIKYKSNVNSASMEGFLVHTNTESVYIYADYHVYKNYGLYEWQLERIFGKGNVPKNLLKGRYEYNGKDSSLIEVIEYLEEEFAEWVQENCQFIVLTEKDIESDYGLEGFEVGDRTLSELGLEQFKEKQLEYKKRLETVGFTYDFTGGLIWL